MSATLRFLLNGTSVAVEGVSPSTMLLAWLREERQLTGTKEGCAEGDCGACTVVLAQPHDQGLCWTPINACIRPLASIAGKAVFTVEGLKADDGALHPVQQAMIDAHASQCGFCTPGFVMSLFGLYKRAGPLRREDVDDAISGNLCRCTGYRPILDAAIRMHELPAPADWRAPGTNDDGDLNASEAALRRALDALPSEALDFAIEGERWIAPSSEDELANEAAKHPDAVLVAGATDVGLWITKQHRTLPTMISTLRARDMARIERDAEAIDIGAGASLADAFDALLPEYPELRESVVRFASIPIRHGGTLGGNIANGSPIGDSMPVLIALGAKIVLRLGAQRRELPLEDFYLGYQKNARQPGEIVTRIRVPRRAPGLVLRAWKISKRYDQDISAVFACFALRMDCARIVDARIGCGGVAPVPVRARRAEEVLSGAMWTEETAERAARAIESEFTPIDDMRASASFRRAVLANLLRRLWHETGARTVAPTRIDDARIAGPAS